MTEQRPSSIFDGVKPPASRTPEKPADRVAALKQERPGAPAGRVAGLFLPLLLIPVAVALWSVSPVAAIVVLAVAGVVLLGGLFARVAAGRRTATTTQIKPDGTVTTSIRQVPTRRQRHRQPGDVPSWRPWSARSTESRSTARDRTGGGDDRGGPRNPFRRPRAPGDTARSPGGDAPRGPKSSHDRRAPGGQPNAPGSHGPAPVAPHGKPPGSQPGRWPWSRSRPPTGRLPSGSPPDTTPGRGKPRGAGGSAPSGGPGAGGGNAGGRKRQSPRSDRGGHGGPGDSSSTTPRRPRPTPGPGPSAVVRPGSPDGESAPGGVVARPAGDRKPLWRNLWPDTRGEPRWETVWDRRRREPAVSPAADDEPARQVATPVDTTFAPGDPVVLDDGTILDECGFPMGHVDGPPVPVAPLTMAEEAALMDGASPEFLPPVQPSNNDGSSQMSQDAPTPREILDVHNRVADAAGKVAADREARGNAVRASAVSASNNGLRRHADGLFALAGRITQSAATVRAGGVKLRREGAEAAQDARNE